MKRNGFIKLLKSDYMLSAASKISTVLIGLISSVFSTRYLGVVNKGAYSYITQVSRISVILCNLGIYQSYSYNYKRFGKDTLKKYSDIFFLQFVIFAALAVVACFVSRDFYIIMAALLVPFNMIKMQYENIMLIENLRLRMFLHIFNQILLTLCYAVLYFTAESNVAYVVLLTVFVDAFTVVFYLSKLKYLPKIWEVDFKLLKQVLKFGFLPMLSLLLVTVNYSVDIFFLERLGTAEELGQYSFAVTIISYVWMLPDAFKEVLFSKSAKKFDKNNISISVKISIASMLCCLVGFTVLGKFLIKFVYGSEFLPSYNVVLILMFGAFPMAMFKLLGIVLISQGRRKAHFISLAVSAVINIVANIITVPLWGMYGAAWASVASYSVCGVMLTVYFCRTYSFGLQELLLPSKEDFVKIKSLIKKK